MGGVWHSPKVILFLPKPQRSREVIVRLWGGFVVVFWTEKEVIMRTMVVIHSSGLNVLCEV